jgi:hypothetical protein
MKITRRLSSALDRSGNREKAVPPSPLPRDKQGWRVAPAPDGRGTPEEHQPRPPHRAEVTQLLSDHREQLDSLTSALSKAETLDAPDAYAAAGVPMRSAEHAAVASPA